METMTTASPLNHGAELQLSDRQEPYQLTELGRISEKTQGGWSGGWDGGIGSQGEEDEPDFWL